MATFTPSTRIDPRTGKLKWCSRFVSLPHAMLTHWTYRELSGGAVKLIDALAAAYAGNNNGHLTATFSHMRKFGFNSKDSLAKGIHDLIAFGYIVRTKAHHLRSPALYAVTWLPINEAPVGQPYDPGVVPGDKALDLWRCVDSPKARIAA